MAYKVLVTAEADSDIDEVIGYIVNSLKNPIAAKNLLSEIESSYDILMESPEAFACCEDGYLRELGYRKIPVKNYIIFYRVDHAEKTVYIMRVIYGRRDYANLI